MLTLKWLQGLMRHRRGRLGATVGGIALAVALLASIGAFLSASKATMTQRAAASVSVDWQVEAQHGSDPAAIVANVLNFPGTRVALPVMFARTAGFVAVTGTTTQTTGAGVVLGIPDGYRSAFPDQIRDLTGATSGVLLAQQTAANLHVSVGDPITFNIGGTSSITLNVDGIVDLPQADSLFQIVGAPAQAQPKAPPDNVLLLPAVQWHTVFDALTVERPELVTSQVHVDLASSLPSDPSAAYFKIVGDAHNLELRLTGTGLVGNNLGAKLGSARSDSLYAQVLFLFLGLPGAVLAGLLTTTVAASGADRRRRDQALLRTRGATTRQLVNLGLGEAAIVGVAGSVIGLSSALVIGNAAFGSLRFGATAAAAAAWAGAAAMSGLMIAAAAIALPAWRDARELTVAAARRHVGRPTSPRWMRWKVDLVLIAVSLVVFWLTSRSGYKLVLAVEGVPTISVNYWAFAGPALLWVGVGLCTWRLASSALQHGKGAVSFVLRPLCGGLAGTVASSMSRQRQLLARSVTLIALTAAFAGSTSVFNATYRQQAEVDAVLSNGSDVTVIEPPGVTVTPSAGIELTNIDGVQSVTPLQHRFAYVGNDLQDLYGIDPATIVQATKLQDSYFEGGSADALMAKLAATPDAVLVSRETVRDFQLNPGDTIRLRLQDGRTKQYTEVPFTYAGVIKKFPSAPSDSFIVANAAYVARTTGNDTVGTFLVEAGGGRSTAVAQAVQAKLGPGPTVTDIASKRRKIGSSLTAVELAGLTTVELGFAVALTAAAAGLVLWTGLAERRRTFAIAAALGANRRQLGSFIWSEAIFTSIGGIAAGALGGYAITAMVIKVLTGVFDPPPASLAIPWNYLALVTACGLGSVAVATGLTIRSTRHLAIQTLRDI